MRKFSKKIYTLILTLLFIVAAPLNVFATNTTSTAELYSHYTELKSTGVIGNDVTFDIWHSMMTRSYEMLTELEDSTDFSLVYSGTSVWRSRFDILPGDIIITNDPNTALLGYIGHAGIAVSDNDVLHIQGTGYTPQVISFDDGWCALYPFGTTYIYRLTNDPNNEKGSDAAQWARETYEDSGATYQITLDEFGTNPTYCSKIVWQAYYLGLSPRGAVTLTGDLVAPFDLPRFIYNTALYRTI